MSALLHIPQHQPVDGGRAVDKRIVHGAHVCVWRLLKSKVAWNWHPSGASDHAWLSGAALRATNVMRLVCLFIYFALAEMLLLAASVWHVLTASPVRAQAFEQLSAALSSLRMKWLNWPTSDRRIHGSVQQPPRRLCEGGTHNIYVGLRCAAAAAAAAAADGEDSPWSSSVSFPRQDGDAQSDPVFASVGESGEEDHL